MLQLFGVAGATEQVYRTMLGHPRADPSELAQLLGLPLDEVTAELDRLAQLLLVEPAPNGPSRYHAVPPDQALEVLISREEERLREMQLMMQRSREGLKDYVETFVESRVTRDAMGLVEQIDDGMVVRSRLFQLVRDARSSVRVQMPGDALPAEAIPSSARLDDEVLGRGLTVRFLVSESSIRAAHWLAHLREQAGKGAAIRLHPSPPLQSVIVDEGTALLPRSGSAGAFVLHGPDIVSPVIALFDEVWQHAEPLPADTEAEAQFSEARLRQVVAMLAQGHKDETIARKLSTSVRTVRRLVAAAIDELQAESRFQAGVEAVRRGWVS